jgi:hypothetical protein
MSPTIRLSGTTDDDATQAAQARIDRACRLLGRLFIRQLKDRQMLAHGIIPGELPFIDQHTRTIEATAEDVWAALLETLDHSFSSARAALYAQAVGCRDCKTCGPRPLTVGSTFPGFRVVAAIPGSRLVLEGRHRFSSYALTFRLEQIRSDRSLLSAETRAAFPGWTGCIYRVLVIGTRGHVVGVRRLLSAVSGRAEQRAR